MRGPTAPDGGPPVRERMDDNDRLLVDNDSPAEQGILKTAVAFPDAMRFKGAAPEVINSRLAMLGMATSAAATLVTGKGIVEQVKIAPVPIALTFLLFSVASLIPILKGVPRSPKAQELPVKGSSFWSPDAEIINGELDLALFYLDKCRMCCLTNALTAWPSVGMVSSMHPVYCTSLW